jgi:hypothetical protein
VVSTPVAELQHSVALSHEALTLFEQTQLLQMSVVQASPSLQSALVRHAQQPSADGGASHVSPAVKIATAG